MGPFNHINSNVEAKSKVHKLYGTLNHNKRIKLESYRTKKINPALTMPLPQHIEIIIGQVIK